eukprot:1178345-Amphidinium_carterae.1
MIRKTNKNHKPNSAKVQVERLVENVHAYFMSREAGTSDAVIGASVIESVIDAMREAGKQQ